MSFFLLKSLLSKGLLRLLIEVGILKGHHVTPLTGAFSVFLLLFLSACGSPPKPQPIVIDPNITAAVKAMKVEDFFSSGEQGAALSKQVRAGLQYEGIKLAEGDNVAILRGKLIIDPLQVRCSQGEKSGKKLYICDKNGEFVVEYRLFDAQGKILLTGRETKVVMDMEGPQTTEEAAKGRLDSNVNITNKVLQRFSQKIVKRLLQR